MNYVKKNIVVRIYPALSSVLPEALGGLVSRRLFRREMAFVGKGLRLRNYILYQSLISKTW